MSARRFLIGTTCAVVAAAAVSGLLVAQTPPKTHWEAWKTRVARPAVDQKLTDPALHEIASMVHDADLDDDKFRSPESPGLDAIVRGLGLVTPDDQELLRFTERVYDGLYAWFQLLTR